MGQVRIIGGIHRSRILKFKDDVTGLRPTPDRVRETVFNWLGQTLTGKTCLDLFAGSGAFAFEAMSRGAKSVLMLESNKAVYTDLLNNAKLLKVDNVLIKNQNAKNYISQSAKPLGESDFILQHNQPKHDGLLKFPTGWSPAFDIIFIDPPHKSELLQQCLKALSGSTLINEDTSIYIEYQTKPDLTGYEVIKEGRAGVVHFALLKIKGV